MCDNVREEDRTVPCMVADQCVTITDSICCAPLRGCCVLQRASLRPAMRCAAPLEANAMWKSEGTPSLYHIVELLSAARLHGRHVGGGVCSDNHRSEPENP